MSTDFSIRPVGTPAATPIVQAPSEAASSAIATELPASQSVTAVDVSASVRNDPQAASSYVSASGVYRSGSSLDRLSGG